MSALGKVCEAVGGAVRLAERLSVSPQRLNNWRKRGVPAEFVQAVCDAAPAAGVLPHELAPKVFKAPAPSQQAMA